MTELKAEKKQQEACWEKVMQNMQQRILDCVQREILQVQMRFDLRLRSCMRWSMIEWLSQAHADVFVGSD